MLRFVFDVHMCVRACVRVCVTGVYAAACALAQSAGSFEAVIGDLSVHPVLGSLTKFSIAFPFVYHSMNGLRHLVSSLGILLCVMSTCSHCMRANS